MPVGPYDRTVPKDDVVRMCVAIDDIRPVAFRNRIHRRLRESAMTAGKLTRLAAQSPNRTARSEEIDRRVVGVQLIYEGLKLSRTLARAPRWDDDRSIDPDVDLLVSGVLVARGFLLLARTQAAPQAIETVLGFAREETNRRVEGRDPDRPDRVLEADVYELGIVAGATATGASRPTGTREFARELAAAIDDERTDEEARFPTAIVDELEGVIGQG